MLSKLTITNINENLGGGPDSFLLNYNKKKNKEKN